MSDESIGQTPAVYSSKERAALVAKALSDAARRARFTTKRRRSLTAGNLRARRGERIFQLVRLYGFIALVAIPVLTFGAYIFLIASSQYVAEARFTVVSGLPVAADGLGSMTGLESEMVMQDTQILLSYFETRAAVETLDKKIGLKSYFESDDIDWFSRLPQKESIEKFVLYWKKHLDVKVELPGGIVTFGVRAFSPTDAVKLTAAVLDAGEELINRMNDQLRKDAVTNADSARMSAEAHLVQTRTDLERARNEEGMLSPEATSEGFQKILDQVRGQMVMLQSNYDAQRQSVDEDAPQLRNLKTKIEAAKEQIAKLEARITTSAAGTQSASLDDAPGGGSRVLSMSMTRLDYAKLENDIAEKIYAASLAALEEARVSSEIKLMYLNRFIEPVEPQQSKYPKRTLSFVILTLASFALWGAVLGGTRLALNKLL